MRFDLHTLEVLGCKEGMLPSHEVVRDQSVGRLEPQSLCTATCPYLQLLAGHVEVKGVELEGAATPLVRQARTPVALCATAASGNAGGLAKPVSRCFGQEARSS
jgi:hypothetical protein